MVVEHREVYPMIAARRICASKPAGRRREGSPDGLSSGNFPRHPDRARRGFSETELSVQAVRRDVGDQTDIGRLWQLVLDMVRQRSHDHLAKPPALVFGHDRDVGDLKEAASVADDATHANYRVAAHQADTKDRVGQPPFGRLFRKGAEARQVSQAQVIVDARDAGLDAVIVMLGHVMPFNVRLLKNLSRHRYRGAGD